MSHNKGARLISYILLRFILPVLIGLCLVILLLLAFLFFKNNNSHAQNRKKTHAFYVSYYKKNANIPEVAYATLNGLYSLASTTKDYETFEIRILKHIQTYPKDPNNGYYFLLLGNIAKKRNAPQQAYIQYTRASQFSPSVAYRYLSGKNSIHESMKNIAQIETDPQRAIYYNTLLLQNYQDLEKKTTLYYKVGQSYERLGLWNNAYKAYNKFLQNKKNTAIATGKQEHDEQIRDIHFRLARRTVNMAGRIWNSAENARKAVSYTLLQGSPAKLNNMRAPSFFIVQWDDDILNPSIYIPKFKIHAVLRKSNIYMERTFSAHSTYTKKFWRITGWNRVSEWFFVFQKIYQPDIPLINGSWEWTGIYLGSKYAKPHQNL